VSGERCELRRKRRRRELTGLRTEVTVHVHSQRATEIDLALRHQAKLEAWLARGHHRRGP
jgi:hypothetical protein